MDQSLDDIIKRKRANKPGRGRGQRGGQQQRPGNKARGQMRNTPHGGRGMVTKRGRGGMVNKARITDARFKIIAKKRQTIVDARDQLAQIAKQTDARDKLNLLHKHQKGGLQLKSRGAEARGRGNQSWRGSKPAAERWPQTSRGSNRGLQSRSSQQSARGGLLSARSGRGGFMLKKAPANLDVDLMYDEDEEDYMDQIVQYSKTIPQRTVRNAVVSNMNRRGMAGRNYGTSRGEVFGGRMPPIPALKVKVPAPELEYEDNYYEEDEMDMDMDDVEPVMPVRSRPPPVRQQAPARPVAISRPGQSVRQSNTLSANYPRMRQDWGDLNKTSIVVRNEVDSGLESTGHMSQQLRSRLDVGGRPGFSQSTAATPGFKVMVTNLQASVTEEDIKELFGDIGPLLQWRLVRPGTAEVIYKQRSHAVNAVDVYHKRQLDGQPMNVVQVNPQSAAAKSSAVGKSASKPSVQPDMGIIYKALFAHK